MTTRALAVVAGFAFVGIVVFQMLPPADLADAEELCDFAAEEDVGRIRTDDSQVSIVDVEDGKALRVEFGHEKQYPTVYLDGPEGGWDLSAHAGAQATVTNEGNTTVSVALRIDNPGDWRNQPWNVEHTRLAPGETKTIRVTFGRSWGAPSYDLDPARVVRAAIYLENPTEDATLLIERVESFGTAPARGETDEVSPDGLLFSFDEGFDLKGRVEERGATARLHQGRLEIEFGTNERWPGVYLLPSGKRWDLSSFESLQMEATNLSDADVRVLVRVDNPNPDGLRNCNTDGGSVKANATKTLKVTFGKSWGGQGFDLDESNVVGLLVMVDNPNRKYTVAIDDVKANPKQWAELPPWLGQRPPVEGDWVLTLDENFDGGKLDQGLWTPRLCWDGPAEHELQRYLEQNVYVEDGTLKIRCERSPGHQYDNPNLPTRDYATGAVTTLDKRTQAYGYLEARIKRPTARGLWPAFWMMPDRGPDAGDIWQRRTTGKGGMEIDIWEHLCEWGPGRYNAATHWDGYGDDHQTWGTSDLYHLPTRDGWHVYGLLWEPGKLTWYCDGKKMVEWQNERVTSVPLYIKFTVQMGGWATKDVDDASLPDFLQVDYVRAWQLRERIDNAP